MKTVLITGANRGIGLATSKLLRKKKYNIIGVARSKVRNFPGKFFECDLSNANEIELLIKKLKDCMLASLSYDVILFIIYF